MTTTQTPSYTAAVQQAIDEATAERDRLQPRYQKFKKERLQPSHDAVSRMDAIKREATDELAQIEQSLAELLHDVVHDVELLDNLDAALQRKALLQLRLTLPLDQVRHLVTLETEEAATEVSHSGLADLLRAQHRELKRLEKLLLPASMMDADDSFTRVADGMATKFIAEDDDAAMLMIQEVEALVEQELPDAA
jgi:hypothetical protein